MDRMTRARVALKLEQLDSKLKSFLANYRARNPRECASSMYFAVFHAAEALLYAKGIEAASHKAVASLLAMHFVRPGTLPRETSAKFSALMAGPAAVTPSRNFTRSDGIATSARTNPESEPFHNREDGVVEFETATPFTPPKRSVPSP